ncbi:MAG: hypothetical protein AB1492_07785 [Bacillota bacterium]
MQSELRIAVVGPCCSGKSTLVEGLRGLGWSGAYVVLQEHSCVPTLWVRRAPHVLIYLDCTHATAARRRELVWGPERHAEQRKRLADARARCDLLLPTDALTITQVREAAVEVVARCVQTEGRPL